MNFGPGYGGFNKIKFKYRKGYQSINTFTQNNRHLQVFIYFHFPFFITSCPSETSYIQCIVCIAAVYFDILHLKYFKLLGVPISSFLTKPISICIRVFLLLVIASVLFFRLACQAFSGFNTTFTAHNHIANYL